jgi:hypothetical protein
VLILLFIVSLMAKTKQTIRLQRRDWAIIVLALAIVDTNWVWYQVSKSQDITNRSNDSSWLAHQVEINKLKACTDDNVRPCDITPPRQ